MPLELSAIGTVEASSSVAIRAQITGELTSVNFKEGDDVEQGQVLFTLDRRPLEGALKQAEAALARDQAQLANARAQAERSKELAARGIATREQVDTTSTAAAALEATVGADRAAIENASVQLAVRHDQRADLRPHRRADGPSGQSRARQRSRRRWS